ARGREADDGCGARAGGGVVARDRGGLRARVVRVGNVENEIRAPLGGASGGETTDPSTETDRGRASRSNGSGPLVPREREDPKAVRVRGSEGARGMDLRRPALLRGVDHV